MDVNQALGVAGMADLWPWPTSAEMAAIVLAAEVQRLRATLVHERDLSARSERIEVAAQAVLRQWRLDVPDEAEMSALEAVVDGAR